MKAKSMFTAMMVMVLAGFLLEQDLVFMTDNGKTNITQDGIGNTYDRVGGPYSNFKP